MWQCPTATHCFGFDFEKMRSRVNFWRCWFQVIVRPWLRSRLTRSYSLVGIAPPVSCLIAPATSYAWPVPDPGIGCYANDRPSGGEGSFLLPPTWEELAGVDQQKISADICFEASWTHSLEGTLDLMLLTQLPLMNGFSFTNDSFNTFLHVQLKEIG